MMALGSIICRADSYPAFTPCTGHPPGSGLTGWATDALWSEYAGCMCNLWNSALACMRRQRPYSTVAMLLTTQHLPCSLQPLAGLPVMLQRSRLVHSLRCNIRSSLGSLLLWSRQEQRWQEHTASEADSASHAACRTGSTWYSGEAT